jgi:hypothetical protein
LASAHSQPDQDTLKQASGFAPHVDLELFSGPCWVLDPVARFPASCCLSFALVVEVLQIGVMCHVWSFQDWGGVTTTIWFNFSIEEQINATPKKNIETADRDGTSQSGLASNTAMRPKLSVWKNAKIATASELAFMISNPFKIGVERLKF